MRALLFLVACGGPTRVAEPLPQPEPPAPVRPRPEKLATSDQCDRLLAHLIELELVATGKTLDQAEKQTHIDATRDKFHEVCDHMPAARVECALRAVDLDGFAKCDDSP